MQIILYLFIFWFRINSSGFHGSGHIEGTVLQIVAVLAAPLADTWLVGPRIASSTSTGASAASACGRGLLGVLLLLLLDLGTEGRKEVLAPAPRAGRQAVVSFDLGNHLPGVESRDGRHLHFVLCGLLEKMEVVPHAHHGLPGEGQLGRELLHPVLDGVLVEDLLDDLGDLLLGPEAALLGFLFHLVQREAHRTEGVAVARHGDRLLGLVELVARGGGILLGVDDVWNENITINFME